MRKSAVYRNKILAGTLTEASRNNFIFQYDPEYFINPKMPAISLTIPKTRQEYQSDSLFPCFFNMLSEGVNRKLQCRMLHVDENDFFGLLLATAGYDTVGAITVKPIDG